MIESIYNAFKNSAGICTDTRQLGNNKIFIALKGENFNGNDFLLNAIDSGCSHAIADEDRSEFQNNSRIFIVSDGLKLLQDLANHHRSKLKIPIVALTGSNGKTTTKELLHAALSGSYNCYSTRGNLNNHIGVPISLLEITSKHEIAIIEMGANHQLEIAQLCDIAEPNHGFITNIGLAHFEGFGGENGVYIGKKELFDFIIARNGTLFLNIDDDKIMRASSGYEGTTYGISTEAIYQGKPALENGQLRVVWKRSDQQKEYEINSKLTGIYNFSNIMAAVTVARYFGVPHRKICQAISDYVPTNNRSQLEKTDAGNTLIIDCYNANPDSMLAAIDNLSEIAAKQRVAILGYMKELGGQTETEHQRIISELTKHPNTKVYLVGESFKLTQNHDYQIFSVIEKLKIYLEENELKDSTILLKGSRSMKLETLLKLL
jgi:UDP-N-acetylmuramoyl-tripeptide--D-alanyl-D-alanine ligase